MSVSGSSARPAPDSLGGTGEFDFIDRLTSGFVAPPGVLIGPGDDAAVVAAPDGRVVISTDVLVDGVHFRSDWATGDQIGMRAALAAMADIAAMGARPTALVVGFGAPLETKTELALSIGAGLRQAASEAGASVVGGDVTRAPALTLSVTVLGDLQGRSAVRRSGARPGDVVCLAGRIGWAAGGLTVLSRGFRSPVALVNAYRVPEPPLTLGPVAAASGATAMIDVSDGLLADLGHIASASGVAIDVDPAGLGVHPRLREVATALGRDPMEWVLTGGDDHALVATFPPDTTLPLGWTVIGAVREAGGDNDRADSAGSAGGARSADRADRAGTVTVGGAVPIGLRGWDHFS